MFVDAKCIFVPVVAVPIKLPWKVVAVTEVPVTFPFVKYTFEILDWLANGALIVPPINALPVTPNPPDTLNVPVVVDEEFTRLVKASPEAVTNPLDGLTTNDVVVVNPSPEPDETFTNVIKKD